MSYYLGIDVGGTNLRAAVATDDLAFLSRLSEPTPTASASAVSEAIRRLVQRACADAGVSTDRIRAAGVGSAGPFDDSAGAIVGSPNIPSDGGRIEIVEPLRELLGTGSVVLRNDAICGAVAERHFADTHTEHMVYITISTGVGAGAIIDGEVLSGANGNAAEIGHLTVDPTGRMACGCGRDGHWEAYCGGANIPDYAASIAREEEIETDLSTAADDFTAKDVFDALGDDELADTVVERIGDWNTIGFANTIQAFAPTRIAVGGAVASNNPGAILDPVRGNVPDRVMVEVPAIELTDLGDDIVLKGALLSARQL